MTIHSIRLNYYITWLLCIAAVLCVCNTHGQNRYRVISYNIENLFDTIANPAIRDKNFTPNGKFAWNTERYNTKLNNLTKVINALCDTVAPLFISVCEAENSTVLKDWLKQPKMKQYNLKFIHFNSADPRGIDVALLYNKKLFKPTYKTLIPIQFDFDNNYNARGILYVKGKFNKQQIHVFVNHWSSRKGGAEISDGRRLRTAKILRAKINEILATNPNARIFVTGDFNDPPFSISVSDSLNAKQNLLTIKSGDLYNLMSEAAQKGKYSFNFEGEQDMLDQIIVTQNFVAKDCILCIDKKRGEVFQPKWLMYKSDKFGLMPNRTFAGYKYIGGYSDHLPVYTDVIVK
jgi:predicted extracellular nuclease